jgi:hypothetical protein
MAFPKSFQVGGSLPTPITIITKTAAYTVAAGDSGTIINCISGTFTVSLTTVTLLGAGFNVTIWNTGTGTVTVDPAGTEQIGSSPGNGNTTYRLQFGAGIKLVCDGTFWHIEIAKPYGNYASTICLGENALAYNNYALAIGPGTNATGLASTAFGGNLNSLGTISAGGNYSFAAGVNSAGSGSQVAGAGAGAMALGGSYASGTDSFAAAITNNTSTYGATATSAVAMGSLAKASASYSLALGQNAAASGTNSIAIGKGAVASGTSAVVISSVAAGDPVTASGTRSIVIGQEFALASGAGSIALGHGRAILDGKLAFGVGYYSNANALEAQTGTMVLIRATTDATATVLTSDNSAPGALNQVVLPNNSVFAFTGLIAARQQSSGGTQSAGWKIEGLIRRGGSAGTMDLVASAINTISNVPGWVIALTADTTNGGLAVTVTGAAATNIRWAATMQTSEVVYT